MSIKPRILVTSAAGHTGAAAVTDLLKKGVRVRAFVRREDARSERLRQAGAEIFVGDLYDMGDIRRSLVDVQRAYYVPPFAPNLLHGMVKMMLTRLPDFDRWEAERGHPMLAEPKLAIDNPEWMASAEQQKLALLNPSTSSEQAHRAE